MIALRFYLLSIFSCSLFLSPIQAQTETRIGDWKQYLPYISAVQVTQSPSHLYFASDFSILKMAKSDLTPTFITKVEGLSDVDVATTRYNPHAEQLLVAYTNSNLDLLDEEGVHNFREIQDNNAILGDKSIYNIYYEDDTWAYLACGFGLVQLNVKEREFGFTTFTGNLVQDVTIFGDSIYISTDKGIYRTARSNPNPAFFGSWQLLGDAQGLPASYASSALCIYQGRLYANAGGALYTRREDGRFEKIEEKSTHRVKYLSAEGAHLLVGWECTGDCDGILQLRDANGLLRESKNLCIRRPINGIEDESGRIWLADQFFTFKSITPEGNCEILPDFNTPFSHYAADIVVDEQTNDLYIASGGIQSNGGYQFRSDGFFRLSEGKWKTFSPIYTPQLADPYMFDFNNIAIDPDTRKVYIGTYWGGVWEFDGTHFTNYNKNNSSLQGAVGDELRDRVSGLAFDNKGNLWVSNFGAPRPVSVRLKDGSWKNFKPSGHSNLMQVVVDKQNNKWFAVQGTSGGVLIFNEGEDLNSTADDKVRFINSGNTVMTSNTVNCLAVDLDGAVWVGTDAGPFVFECGSNIFEASCRGSQRRVVEGGIPALLLDGEDIRAIAIDGGNRKWFGSTNGVYVQSASGEQQIHKFNVDNSPLFDNTIQRIGINNNTGEVFIATDKGMVSYKGEATQAPDFHIESNILAYPNPVRPEYEGPIAIKGLARDANVKITDVSGRLVYETQAIGGQALWYGKDLSGRRVATGVYLVFSTADLLIDRPDAAVAKIVFIN